MAQPNLSCAAVNGRSRFDDVVPKLTVIRAPRRGAMKGSTQQMKEVRERLAL
jgi:hypothetical protein